MYREQPPRPQLTSRVRCVWTQHRARDLRQNALAASASTPLRSVSIVPDTCSDIVWSGSELRVAGPDTRPMIGSVRPDKVVLGLRFHCGAGGSVLGVPLPSLRDARVQLHTLWGDDAKRLADALHEARSEAQALSLMQQALLAREHLFQPLDPLASRLVFLLSRATEDPELRMTRVARELGLSERQLHRRCVAAVGYAPKLLARILRMQRFREALRSTPERPLSTLAFELGFADQAHLSHESARLFGQSPSQLRKAAQRASASDFDKTAHPPLVQTAPHERAQSNRQPDR